MEVVAVPDFQPLRNSHEADVIEAQMKQLFIDLFNNDLRALERELNVYGMPHLGSLELLQRNVTGDGLALYKKDDVEAMRYIFKAWRGRNGKRGLHFLRTYLQLLWPNNWTADQLWMPKDGEYPTDTVTRDQIADADAGTNFFLTSRIRLSITDPSEDGTTILQIQPALRSVLAARFVLIVQLIKQYASTGEFGYGLACGAARIAIASYAGDCLPPDSAEEWLDAFVNNDLPGSVALGA